MRIGDTHLSTPVFFPPNLILIGTMDTADFDWWDEDLLSGVTVIDWFGDVDIPLAVTASESQNFGHTFLRPSLRSSRKGYKKFLSMMTGIKQPLQTAMTLRSVFRTHGVEFPQDLLDEVMRYHAQSLVRAGEWFIQSSHTP